MYEPSDPFTIVVTISEEEMMVNELCLAVDEYGRAILGDDRALEIIANPKEGYVYDWDGSFYKQESFGQQVGEPLVIAGAGIIGCVLLVTYGMILSGASIVDKILGKTGKTSYRHRIDVWMTEDVGLE